MRAPFHVEWRDLRGVGASVLGGLVLLLLGFWLARFSGCTARISVTDSPPGGAPGPASPGENSRLAAQAGRDGPWASEEVVAQAAPPAAGPSGAGVPPGGELQTVIVDGVEVRAAPGATVEVERTVSDAGGSVARSASGTGAALTASGDQVDTNFKQASAPVAGLGADGSGSASGGTFAADAWAEGALGFSPLWVFGGLALAGAAWFAYTRRFVAAAAAGVLALACCAAAVYPSLLPLGLAAVLAGGAVWWAERKGLLQARAAGRYREGVRAVVAGVEALPEGARREVKASIEQHADDADRETIRAVKRADGYGGER